MPKGIAPIRQEEKADYAALVQLFRVNQKKAQISSALSASKALKIEML